MAEEHVVNNTYSTERDNHTVEDKQCSIEEDTYDTASYNTEWKEYNSEKLEQYDIETSQYDTEKAEKYSVERENDSTERENDSTEGEKYSVYSEFDAIKHKNTFVNYLEVIINYSGKVEYAVPSHQLKLVHILMEQNHLEDEEDAWNLIPVTADVISMLCTLTGCICVWDEFFACGEIVSKKQMATLRQLKMLGLYKGSLSKPYVREE